MTSRIEDELRAAFAQATEDLALPADWRARDARARAHARTRRRVSSMVAVAVAAVAVVTVGLGVMPVTAAWRRPAVDPEGRAGTRAAPQPPAMASWPTRGDLAGDRSLTDSARSLLARDGSVLSIPFAGRLGDHAVVVAVIQRGPRFALGTLYGRTSDPVNSWERAFYSEVRSDPWLSVADQDPDGTVHLAVLLGDSGKVGYSPQPTYSDDGSARRNFAALPIRHGLGLTSFAAPTLQAISIRTVVGTTTAVGGLDVRLGAYVDHVTRTADVSRFAALAGSPPCRKVMGADDLIDAAGAALRPLNVPFSKADVQVGWCRAMGRRSAALVAVQLRSGPAFQVLYWISKDGAPEYQVMPVPAGRSRDYPLAAVSHVPTGGMTGDQALKVLVSAPRSFSVPMGARVAIVAGPGSTTRLAEGAVDGDGVVELALDPSRQAQLQDPNTEVVVRDQAGRVVEHVKLTRPEAADPLGLSVDGPMQ